MYGKIKPDKDSIPKKAFVEGVKLKDNPELLEIWREDVKAMSVKNEIVTPRAYVLFYKRRGFKCETSEDFEKIKIKSLGTADHLLKIDKPVEPSEPVK